MSAAVALQAVLSGLAFGAVYGLLGVGYTLIHRLTRIHHLGYGDVVIGAIFVALLTSVGRQPVVIAPGALASVAQVFVALLGGALLSAAVYATAVRPALRATRADSAVAGWVVGVVLAGLIVREALALVFPRESSAVADPLRLDRITGSGLLELPGGQSLPVRSLGVFAVALLAGIAVERLVTRTRFGRALRAVADDPDTAALMGIDRERMVLAAFALAGLLAGLAGLLAAPSLRLTVGGGVLLGLKAAAAALVGGLGRPAGALAGGLAIGVLEALAGASTALGPAYVDVLPLALLVVVLALRPEGLGTRAQPVPR